MASTRRNSGSASMVKIEQRRGVERGELGVEFRWRGGGNDKCHVALLLNVKHPDYLNRKPRLAEAALAVNDLRLHDCERIPTRRAEAIAQRTHFLVASDETLWWHPRRK